ncbi:hypothetical protein RHSIM_Rhsim09G0055700 [Rhododendron simsii]|uniref:type II protein arginine methyltransferase n=1 Tax=Rhododendron simsii TaxID=118357 RepID=A0A834LEZ4_RHOSS|nr:hypothetical protein RHSIM_Rhsim09G0055700 [Rhododendron simsii]
MASRSLSSRNLSHLFRTSRVSYCTSLSHPPPAFFSTHIVGDTPILVISLSLSLSLSLSPHPHYICLKFAIFNTQVRDFIRSALYDPNHGYFSQRSGSVGVLDKSIKFNQLEAESPSYCKDPLIEVEAITGRKAYVQYLDTIYKKNDISWFTPVELFKPWYAHGIAESILRTANLSIPLKCTISGKYCNGIRFAAKLPTYFLPQGLDPVPIESISILFPSYSKLIYEIGGGSGTCAKGIMDYIMLNAPTRVYSNMTYISVEISSSLAKKQLETVGEVHTHLSKFRVECRDAADQSGWGMRKKYAVMLRTRWLSFSEKLDVARLSSKLCLADNDAGHWGSSHGDADQQPCWVIMLEVLDNLPHDLIYSENQVSPWMEVWVEKQHERSELSESYKPLQDPLIRRCLEIIDLDKDNTTQGGWATSTTRNIMTKVFPKPRRCWLPTGCLKLLEVLHGALPKMSLIASDFSYLPDVKIPGERAPLVSTKKDGSSADYNSYLNAKGDADIFFPTDFWLLERIDHYSSGWMKLQKDKSSKPGKKRRTITVISSCVDILDTSSFMEEFGQPSRTRTKDGYNPLLDDFKNTKIYLSVPTHNTK